MLNEGNLSERMASKYYAATRPISAGLTAIGHDKAIGCASRASTLARRGQRSGWV